MKINCQIYDRAFSVPMIPSFEDGTKDHRDHPLPGATSITWNSVRVFQSDDQPHDKS